MSSRFLVSDLPQGLSLNGLSHIKIKSEQSNCFSIDLPAVQKFICIVCARAQKCKEATSILSISAPTTEQKLSSIAIQRTAFMIEC